MMTHVLITTVMMSCYVSALNVTGELSSFVILLPMMLNYDLNVEKLRRLHTSLKKS